MSEMCQNYIIIDLKFLDRNNMYVVCIKQYMMHRTIHEKYLCLGELGNRTKPLTHNQDRKSSRCCSTEHKMHKKLI